MDDMKTWRIDGNVVQKAWEIQPFTATVRAPNARTALALLELAVVEQHEAILAAAGVLTVDWQASARESDETYEHELGEDYEIEEVE